MLLLFSHIGFERFFHMDRAVSRRRRSDVGRIHFICPFHLSDRQSIFTISITSKKPQQTSQVASRRLEVHHGWTIVPLDQSSPERSHLYMKQPSNVLVDALQTTL